MIGLVLLAGCGGGGGGPTFESLSNEGLSLLSEHGSKSATLLASMPDSDTPVTYNGVAAFGSSYSAPQDIVAFATTVSDLEMSVTFSDGLLDGRAYNFRNSDAGISTTGEINLDGSVSGNTFDAVVSGTIVETGYGVTAAGVYSGNASGEFVGANAEALIGTGSAVGDYGTLGTINVNAFFGAER